jgi:GTP-binding protein YchF
MSLAIGIIGLAQSGKTTVFNALTAGHSGSVGHRREAAHIGIAHVPEPRLEQLAEILKPNKVVPAEVKYIDIGASVKSLAQDSAISGELLSHLSSADALINVVRAFPEESVPHPSGNVDAGRDITTMNLELAFSDLAIIERRLKKIEAGLKGISRAEHHGLDRERELLAGIKAGLETETPVRQQGLTTEEARGITGYQFLSAKPMLVIINLGEEQIGQAQVMEAELSERYSGPGRRITSLCGQLEMEMAGLDSATAAEFRAGFGLAEPGLERVIRLSYELLGLVTFFTIVSGEFRAWSVPAGTSALTAAGKIHSDMERGFIRAEVVSCPDLVKSGGLAGARQHGLLRLEGKKYIVQDGDVITFLFNI